MFAWKLNVSPLTGRCVYFSPEIYGCQIYVTALDLRPPQSAIYPAGYTTGAAACKAAGPWIVKDREKGAACEKLLHVYRDFCLAEREYCKQELVSSIDTQLRGHFAELARTLPPSRIVGVKDTWNGLEPLEAEGISLSMRQACSGGLRGAVSQLHRHVRSRPRRPHRHAKRDPSRIHRSARYEGGIPAEGSRGIPGRNEKRMKGKRFTGLNLHLDF